MHVPDSHIRVNMISAINNEATLRFMTDKGAMNAALFIAFLTRLLRTTTRKAFQIVDPHSAHDAAEVADWLQARQGRIEVFCLPRRAPEQNLNNDLKGDVHEVRLQKENKDVSRQWDARLGSPFSTPS
jgi:hypothetical protein